MMMRSRSLPSMPARASAWRLALTERVEAVSCGAAIRRSLMPDRETIHSSEVSTIFSKSAFVRTFSGTYIPQPVIALYRAMLFFSYLLAARLQSTARLRRVANGSCAASTPNGRNCSIRFFRTPSHRIISAETNLLFATLRRGVHCIEYLRYSRGSRDNVTSQCAAASCNSSNVSQRIATYRLAPLTEGLRHVLLRTRRARTATPAWPRRREC